MDLGGDEPSPQKKKVGSSGDSRSKYYLVKRTGQGTARREVKRKRGTGSKTHKGEFYHGHDTKLE